MYLFKNLSLCFKLYCIIKRGCSKGIISSKNLYFWLISVKNLKILSTTYAVTNHIIVIHDDTNFKIGQFKIKQSGSAGRHKGVNSIIENFDTDKFIRIKVGVDSKPNENIDLKDWVVCSFSKNQLSIIKKESPFVLDTIKLIINQDIQTAMNKYNSNEMIVK